VVPSGTIFTSVSLFWQGILASKRFFVWDIPTRLFHWTLVLLVTGSFISGQVGGNFIDWHGRFGLAIVGLLAFRMVWGVIGSTYARFHQFFPTPSRLIAYLKGEGHYHGHNPLGALSVFGMLTLLSAWVTTGLFSNDDIAFVGPLYDLVSNELSNRLTGIHRLIADFAMGLIALHVAVILFYSRVKKQQLLKPMITGWKEGEGESARGGRWPALILALILAGAVIYGASGVWLSDLSPPPPPAEIPGW
jgi:cytochrome b